MFTLDEIIAKRNANYHKVNAHKRTQERHFQACRAQQRLERFMKYRLNWVDLESRYPETYTVAALQGLLQAAEAETGQGMLFAAFGLRKMIAGDCASILHASYEAGLLAKITQWAECCTLPQLQYEAVLIANAVAASSIKYTQLLVSRGLLKALVCALESISDRTREEALSALANTASVCVSACDQLAEFSIVKQVVERSELSCNERKYTCWLLSAIARGKCLEDIRKFALPFLVEQLETTKDLEVLIDCCNVLSCLSKSTVQALIDCDAVPRLSSLLGSCQYGVQLAALRTLGDLSTGSDIQAQALLSPCVLLPLVKMVDSCRKQIRKEAVWILSNLCAGPTCQISQVLEEGVIPKVVALVSAQDLDTCREACWVLNNIVLYGNCAQVRALLDTPLVFRLCQVLAETQVQVLSVALRCLKTLLQDSRERFETNDGINPMKELIEASGGVAYIEDLKTHMNAELQRTASDIMSHFFPDFDLTAPSDDEDFLI
jgi:hypothetical protein